MSGVVKICFLDYLKEYYGQRSGGDLVKIEKIKEKLLPDGSGGLCCKKVFFNFFIII